MSHRKRPEHTSPPEIYYDEKEATKYTQNSHIIEVQSKLSERALELLAIPEEETAILLDIGCGSGLSGEIISEHGHTWVGVDISGAMLNVARDRECQGGLVLGDIGNYLPFRSGSFDGAISISAVQWLFNSERSNHNPLRRIRNFFGSLYACLSRGARAVLQCYPENPQQLDLLQTEAVRAGFTGGIVVDFPNSTRAKKYFFVLDVCSSRVFPRGLTGDVEDSNNTKVRMVAKNQRLSDTRGARSNRNGPKKGSSGWIKHKKDIARMRMKEVAHDSRYTGRKRKPKF